MRPEKEKCTWSYNEDKNSENKSEEYCEWNLSEIGLRADEDSLQLKCF